MSRFWLNIEITVILGSGFFSHPNKHIKLFTRTIFLLHATSSVSLISSMHCFCPTEYVLRKMKDILRKQVYILNIYILNGDWT